MFDPDTRLPVIPLDTMSARLRATSLFAAQTRNDLAMLERTA